jgi:hypothetical protein
MPFDRRALAVLSRRHLQIGLERDVLEQPADDIEHLVGSEFLADRFELVEQDLQDPALARVSGDQVDDDDRIALLTVAVNPAHSLLQPGRVPWHVVVHHQPAELKVYASPAASVATR